MIADVVPSMAAVTRLDPVVLHADGVFPCVIAVDHAANAVPSNMAWLGLSPERLASHHGWDRGAGAVAHLLAAKLDVPTILCSASRLVIDCNRWIDDPRSILAVTDGEPVPGNIGLSDRARKARIDGIFWPYHEKLSALVASMQQRQSRPMFLALHSFTRHFRGARRPWDAGTIWHERDTMSNALIAALGIDPDLVFGSNEPYSGQGGVYTVDRHTYGTGIEACGLEIADDLIDDAIGQALWADRLARSLSAVAGTLR